MRKPKTAKNDLREKGKKWLDRVEAAGKQEKKWLDDAKMATEAYTGEPANEKSTASVSKYDFNILFSNVETIVPAVINSPPAPDVRRRFGDADEVARVVAEIIERAIRLQVDDSRLQVELEASAQDAFLAGRGVVRIRFHSDIVGGEPTKKDIKDAAEVAHSSTADGMAPEAVGDDADDAMGGDTLGFTSRGIGDNGGPPLERVENERIGFEAVSWVDYRHSPAKRWDERTWDAFRFCIPCDEEEGSFDRALIRTQLSDTDFNKRLASTSDLCGWEIWDQTTKTVIFIDDAGIVLKEIPDPLGLWRFFCIATPMQPIEINGRLMPVNPFAVYKQLADDLDDAVSRKNVLIKAMKVKGWYGTSAADLQAVMDLPDNEFAPITDPESWAQAGGIEKAIAFWPLEKFIIAIQQLDAAIAQYKQWIYEITGISDIIRGASAAQETATAQNIKSQWGSLRIQKMQRMMERCARDLFVMMSEIIPSKFSFQTLEDMTGIPILPKPDDTSEVLQQKQGVMQLLKRRLASFYRIDVESDSTIRADLTRQKQEVAEFLQGAGSYIQAVTPMVQSGELPADIAFEIFAANTRLFNLGKSVEDALEQTVAQAKQKAKEPQQEKPDPEMVKAQMAAQSEQAKAQIAGAKAQSDQAAAQIQIETIQAKVQADISKVNADVRSKELDSQISIATTNAKMEADRQSHAMEMQKGALELEKIRAEIMKIQVGTAAIVAKPAPAINQGMPV